MGVGMLKNKIRTIYRIFDTIRKNPDSLALLLKDAAQEGKFQRQIPGKYKGGLPVVEFLDICPAQDTIEPYSLLEGTSDIGDIMLLKALARKFDACRFLEIGTWRGETVANVAKVARECVTVDLPDKRRKGIPDIHGFFSKQDNIRHVYCDSLSLDFSSLGKFNLVFIDGKHSYEVVKSDTLNALKVLNENGVIVWHDYGYDLRLVAWGVLKGILDGMPADKHQNIYHVSNTKCAIYTPEKFNTSLESSFYVPNKTFELKISVKTK